MSQADKARQFASLHVPGKPLVLYNIWDAGSALTVAKAGAQAIATGSWSVAAAQGYADGQDMPLELVLQIASRITASVELPVTIDFEGGYAEAPGDVAFNVARLMDAGAIGLNFEDQVIGGSGLHGMGAQADRIAALRQAAQSAEMPLFINARTDLFLKQKDVRKHTELVPEARERAAAYAAAGANCFFVPGLSDPNLIKALCDAIALPVNILMRAGAPSHALLASLGVARISYGPGPYSESQSHLTDRYRAIC